MSFSCIILSAALMLQAAASRYSEVSVFQCQSTLETYNRHVNVGNFTGAAALTFADNVTYFIPGKQPQCPYCDVYVGKERVVELFVDGFLGHFSIINPLVNLYQLTSATRAA